MILKATTQISQVIGGQVSLEDISVSPFQNFPYLSIALKNLRITDSLFNKHRHPLLSAENIFVRINPFALLIAKVSLNKLEVKNASVFLFTDSTGYTNAYLLKGNKKHTATSSEKSTQKLFDRIELTNVSATVQDLGKDKLFDLLINHLDAKKSSTDSSLLFDVKQSILVKSLAFKKSKGTYLENQLLEGNYDISFLSSAKTLRFNDILLTISKHPFVLSGAFVFGNVQEFSIHAKSKELLVNDAKKILTAPIAKAISLVALEKPLDVDATLTGSLNGGDPLVKVNWITKNNALTTPLLSFNDCSFSGFYTNEVIPGKERNDPNSKIEVHNLSGTWYGLKMDSKSIIINDLTNPVVTCDFYSSFALTQLNSLLQSEAMSLTTGVGSLRFFYKGPIEHISPQNAALTGSLIISDGTIHTTAGNADLSRCRGSIRFVNKDIVVDSLFGRLANNPFRMWGTAKNTLALLGDSKEPVSLSWNLYSPILNIDHISSVFLRKLPNKQGPATPKSTSLAKTAQQLDNLLSNGNVNVSIRADKLQFHKFEGYKLQADLSVASNTWTLKKASLLFSKGSFDMFGKIYEYAPSRFRLQSDLHLKNVDATKTFYSFDNFGIKDITYKNIEGTLTANANVSVNLEKTGNFDMSSLSGDADFSIQNGALKKFAPVMKVQEFAFKSRDFSDIQFAEIKDKLKFDKGQIQLDRMEINSSVLSLFVEGIYGLKGGTDISIQVPLKNLKKRDKGYKPENAGTDGNGGMSIFLRAKTAEDGTIKLKYDPFRRFRKS